MVSTWIDDGLLDFVGDPANATFGDSVGMGYIMALSLGSSEKGNEILDVLHRHCPQVC